MANALVLLGAGSSGSGTLTPPSVAPVLTVSATSIGSTDALLEWTASNKTSSAGFQYAVYLQIDSSPESIITYTTSLVYVDNRPSAAGETYKYRIVPENDAGEGPSSNTASVVLPGESSRLLLNAGGNLLLNQTGVLLING